MIRVRFSSERNYHNYHNYPRNIIWYGIHSLFRLFSDNFRFFRYKKILAPITLRIIFIYNGRNGKITEPTNEWEQTLSRTNKRTNSCVILNRLAFAPQTLEMIEQILSHCPMSHVPLRWFMIWEKKEIVIYYNIIIFILIYNIYIIY